MSSIESANAALREVMMKAPKVKESEEMDSDEQIVRRGKYQHFTDVEKLALGKRAYDHGITSTIRYFVASPGEERYLSPSTLFGWKDKYTKELKKHQTVKEFPSAKWGHPLLLGNELDERVKNFLKAFWASSIMTRMNFVKRCGNSKAKVTVSNFDTLKKQYVSDIQVISEFEEIPDELILNWDHTGIN